MRGWKRNGWGFYIGHISRFILSCLFSWDINFFLAPNHHPAVSTRSNVFHVNGSYMSALRKMDSALHLGQGNVDTRTTINSQTALPRDTEKQERKARRDCDKSSPRNSISLPEWRRMWQSRTGADLWVTQGDVASSPVVLQLGLHQNHLEVIKADCWVPHTPHSGGLEGDPTKQF